MRDSKEGAEYDADAADDDVGDAEEGVLAAHDGAGADYDGLSAAVFGHSEICLNVSWTVGGWEGEGRWWDARWSMSTE